MTDNSQKPQLDAAEWRREVQELRRDALALEAAAASVRKLEHDLAAAVARYRADLQRRGVAAGTVSVDVGRRRVDIPIPANVQAAHPASEVELRRGFAAYLATRLAQPGGSVAALRRHCTPRRPDGRLHYDAVMQGKVSDHESTSLDEETARKGHDPQ